MTKQELNRDIKRLWKRFVSRRTKEYDKKIEEELRSEFKRLYYADKDMTYMNANSLRWMLRMNLSLRVVNLHNFGLGIDVC